MLANQRAEFKLSEFDWMTVSHSDIILGHGVLRRCAEMTWNEANGRFASLFRFLNAYSSRFRFLYMYIHKTSQ